MTPSCYSIITRPRREKDCRTEDNMGRQGKLVFMFSPLYVIGLIFLYVKHLIFPVMFTTPCYRIWNSCFVKFCLFCFQGTFFSSYLFFFISFWAKTTSCLYSSFLNFSFITLTRSTSNSFSISYLVPTLLSHFSPFFFTPVFSFVFLFPVGLFCEDNILYYLS